MKEVMPERDKDKPNNLVFLGKLSVAKSWDTFWLEKTNWACEAMVEESQECLWLPQRPEIRAW